MKGISHALAVGRLARTALVLVFASVVVAGTASAASAAPGDNGDVKIHKESTPDSDQRNNPKVCEFFVVGYNFDDGQEISWRIQEGPPFGQPNEPGVLSGTLTADSDGFAKSELLTLPNGHYKLWWNFVGESGSAKHKVFKVDCPPPNGNGNGKGESPPPPPPPPPPGKGILPVTGADFPVGVAGLLGALLLGSGVALIKWRDELLALYRRRH